MKPLYRLAIVLALPLFLVGLMLVQVLKPKPKSWAEQGRVASSTNVLELWREADFVAVDSEADIRAAVSGISFSYAGRSAPSDSQKSAAERVATDFLLAFALKDLNAYRRFRLPTNQHEFGMAAMAYRLESLQERGILSVTEAVDDGRSVVDGWFHLMFMPAKSQRNPVSQDLSRIVTHVAPGASGFHFEDRTSLSPKLNLFVTATNNNGYFEQGPFVTFSPSPEKLLSEKGRIYYLTMWLHVATQLDPPMPIYFRFYWDDRQAKWIPTEHAIPYAQFRAHAYAF